MNEMRQIVKIAQGFCGGMLEDRSSDGMCVAVCCSLASFLRLFGYYCGIVDGAVGENQHCWITLADGSIIDPTADQFKQPDGKPMPRFYQGKQPSWYSVDSIAIPERVAR